MVVAFSPAESKLSVNIAMFSPASFRSLLLACCNVRACAIFSAQACASLARSSDHVIAGTPCIERNLLCMSRDCFGNSSVLDGLISARKKCKLIQICHTHYMFVIALYLTRIMQAGTFKPFCFSAFLCFSFISLMGSQKEKRQIFSAVFVCLI